MNLDQSQLTSPPEDDSQSPSSSPETFMVGFVVANIVGLRYYSGTISGREMVGLVRDPLNQFDPNAIKVLNTQSLQVGYIEKKVASILTNLIDNNLVHIEGIVPNTPKNGAKFKMPCHIHIFAKIETFSIVESAFFRSGLVLIKQNDQNFTISESMVVKEKMKCDLDAVFKLVDENVSRNVENGAMEMEPPKDLILPDLFAHQKEGLYWLYNRENSDELPPFWEQRDNVFVNVLTNYETDKRPDPLRGGIFADDMGLGKTLTLLSLIGLDKVNDLNDGGGTFYGSDNETVVYPSGNKRSRNGKRIKTVTRVTRATKKTTLVVCTPSVLSTWIKQLTDHTKRGMLKAYLYYDSKRTQDVSELEKYDIVLTTYSTLGSEHDDESVPIKKIKWWRVILDEAHMIKNYKSKLSAAVTRLSAVNRWAVTGTPIQNGAVDLFSLMAFLRFEPFSSKNYWDSLVQRPILVGNPNGLSRLQVQKRTYPSLSQIHDQSDGTGIFLFLFYCQYFFESGVIMLFCCCIF